MPLAQIYMIEGRTEEQKKAVIEKVTKALQEAVDAPVPPCVYPTRDDPDDAANAAYIPLDTPLAFPVTLSYVAIVTAADVCKTNLYETASVNQISPPDATRPAEFSTIGLLCAVDPVLVVYVACGVVVPAA